MDKNIVSIDVEETVKEGFESVLEVLDIPGSSLEFPSESESCERTD